MAWNLRSILCRKEEGPSVAPNVEREWKAALRGEEGFWERWLETRGAYWPEDYARRMDPEHELQWHIKPYLVLDPGATSARILDVGAGLLTVLGKKHGKIRLEITAVDPLAEKYDRILARAGLMPAVRTIRGDAERVASMFPESSFDLVYAQNCIDHCRNPIVAIDQMLTLVKPGRFLMLEHAVNEGETMAYDGLHQWNFCLEEGRFTIWRPGWKADAHARFEERAEIEARVTNKWLVVAMKKR